MIFCLSEVMIAATILIYRRKFNHKNSKSIVLIVLLFTGLSGSLLQYKENSEVSYDEKYQIKREDPGNGEKQKEFIVDIPELNIHKDYSVKILEKKLDEIQQNQLFEDGIREAEHLFLNHNASMNHIETSVFLPKSLQNGLLETEWSFDNYKIMCPDGSINEKNIGDNGTIVKATLTMTYQDTDRVYEFPFLVQKKSMSKVDKIWCELEKRMMHENISKSEQVYYQLPNEVEGYRVYWKDKKNHIGTDFAFLGIIAAVAIKYQDKEKEKKRQKQWERELLLGYPEMISKISLLLDAGMSVPHAWKKIALSYKKQREEGKTAPKAVYEEMLVTYYEIQDGVGEIKAYTRFAERCSLQQYRKLMTLLVQNVRKGQQELTSLLEQEADDAFLLRKNLAKKAGEEAGTKLLAPMMVMFLLAMVIILIPACMSFQI